MNPKTIEFARDILRVRAKRAIIACSIALLFIVVVVRKLTPSYRASVRIFVSLPSSTSMDGLPSGMAGLFQDRERASLILAQEKLVTSYPIYSAVQKRLGKRNTTSNESAAPNFLVSLVKIALLGDEFVNVQKLYDVEYEMFASNIFFNTDIQGSNFSVGYKGRDPSLTLETAEYIADALIKLNMQIDSERNKKLTEFLSEKVSDANAELRRANAQVAEFIRKHNFPRQERLVEEKYRGYLQTQQNIAVAEQKLVQSKVKLDQSKSLVEKLNKELRSNFETSNEPRLRALLGEISKLESAKLNRQRGVQMTEAEASLDARLRRLRTELSRELGQTPQIVDTQSLSTALDRAIAMMQESEAETRGVKAMHEQLKRQGRDYAQELSRFPELEAELGNLLFTQNQFAKVHQALTENYLSALTRTDVEFSKLVVLQKPMLSAKLLSSGKLRLLIVLSVMAVFVICGVIVWINYLQETIVNPTQMSRFEHPQFLGVFPHLQRLRPQDGFDRLLKELHIARLGFKISRIVPGSHNVFQVVSEIAGSGKTTTAVGLSAVLAGIGKSVLLIDADYRARHRNLKQYFVRRHSRFLPVKDVETVQAELPQLKEKGLAGKVVVTQVFSRHPSEQQAVHFYESEFHKLIEALRGHFDYVILDSGPMFLVEALLLVERVDTVILCVPEGRMTAQGFAECVHTIDSHRRESAKVISILTNAKPPRSDSYGYQYYLTTRGKRKSA